MMGLLRAILSLFSISLNPSFFKTTDLHASTHKVSSETLHYDSTFEAGAHGVFERAAIDSHSFSVKSIYENDRWYPAINDPETILNFAQISANTYRRQLTKNVTFEDLDGFGWEASGLRGHIYANPSKSLIVIGFKGTSTLFMGGGTVSMDKYMDNLMFSCCCARIDISWIPVCGCFMGKRDGDEEDEGDDDHGWWPINHVKSVESSHGRCNATCIKEAVNDKDSYYFHAKKIVHSVQKTYPHSQIWFTGHSLGGAIASLMAVTFEGTAAITFEAPGDRQYAQRLGISRGPFWAYPIWNFGITTDPVFMGNCQGLTTSCYLSGYAMETKCRHGRDCIFNISDREGKYDINTHTMKWVIENVLQGQYPLPKCRSNMKCQDCPGWEFEEP